MKEKLGKMTSSSGSNTAIAIIPADIVKDSAFPFKLPVDVLVKIDGDRLIIEKARK